MQTLVTSQAAPRRSEGFHRKLLYVNEDLDLNAAQIDREFSGKYRMNGYMDLTRIKKELRDTRRYIDVF